MTMEIFKNILPKLGLRLGLGGRIGTKLILIPSVQPVISIDSLLAEFKLGTFSRAPGAASYQPVVIVPIGKRWTVYAVRLNSSAGNINYMVVGPSVGMNVDTNTLIVNTAAAAAAIDHTPAMGKFIIPSGYALGTGLANAASTITSRVLYVEEDVE